MKTILLAILTIATSTLAINAQNLNSKNGEYEKKRIINGKKYLVTYYEYEINASVDEVWEEVSGNYVNVSETHQAITESHCESGDITEGLGAARFCSIDFDGKKIDVKEKIIEVKEEDDRKEYTYDVYETKGFPAKAYNTWVVRKGADGKTYLGNVFIMRGKPAMMTKMMQKKLVKLGGVRNAVLSYKHYIETGEKKADPQRFDALYPEV